MLFVDFTSADADCGCMAGHPGTRNSFNDNNSCDIVVAKACPLGSMGSIVSLLASFA